MSSLFGVYRDLTYNENKNQGHDPCSVYLFHNSLSLPLILRGRNRNAFDILRQKFLSFSSLSLKARVTRRCLRSRERSGYPRRDNTVFYFLFSNSSNLAPSSRAALPTKAGMVRSASWQRESDGRQAVKLRAGRLNEAREDAPERYVPPTHQSPQTETSVRRFPVLLLME